MKFVPLAALVGIIGSGVFASTLTPVLNPPVQPGDLNAHEEYASASLLGQFRTNFSAWLWLRTDLYLHNGVEMRQMTEEEKKSGLESTSAKDDGHHKLMDESTVLTIIPPRERDFRGVFGDIERATSAYKDMHDHSHNDPRAALPLYRLMTWFDPTFIQGWVTGAGVLQWDQGKEGKQGALKAATYLKEGLKDNPKSVAILNELGQVYAARLHNFKSAIEYLEQARAVGRQKDEVAKQNEQESLEEAYRWLGLCYREDLQLQNMREVASEGLHLFKDDYVLQRLLVTPPMILKPEAQHNWIKQELGTVIPPPSSKLQE